MSVALAVALITGIYSMLDVFMQFEKLQVIHDKGNYHLAIKDISTKERKTIANRIDVENTGRWKDLGEVNINSITCALAALDEGFLENLNIEVIKGKYPTKKNEIMLEQWALKRLQQNLKVGDALEIFFEDGSKRNFIISGIYNDLGHMKAKGVPGVFISMDGADKLWPEKPGHLLVLFKKGVKIIEAEEEIKKDINIPEDRVGRNEHLLAVIGQSTDERVHGLYDVGAILFALVLVAGVVMIYNTFNISVMERVRHFGLLRCVGASQTQIKRMVRREGLYITIRAIPIGIVAGMAITFVCSAILKYYNNTIFGEIPIFTFSIPGIGAGVLMGFLTVFIATLLPAKKAASVSPINAVVGGNDVKTNKKQKQGILTQKLPVEIAMGINNAIIKKKTLLLMSCSIALSIIMFLGFQVFVDFMYKSLRTTKPYTPDISLMSEQGINNDLYTKLSEVEGVKKVYRRMFGYVDATFDATRLTDTYKEIYKDITVENNGLFIPPEKSWLISYDKNQLKWAKEDLLSGVLSEDKMNEQNGIVAVVRNIREGISMETAKLKIGDKVYIKTPSGTKELKVLGILRSVPFRDSGLNLTTFITTEKQYVELTGESIFKVVDIQLESRKQEQYVQAIKELVDKNITLLDARQKNDEIDQTFVTMAVFIYGFVVLIALISILNIINTMNTSVASKIRYMGVMRAVGMSGSQLDKMVLSEAATYSFVGALFGCIMGIMLQKYLIATMLSGFCMVWKFPLAQIILIFIITMLMTVFSVIRPLKRVKAKGVSEVVNSL